MFHGDTSASICYWFCYCKPEVRQQVIEFARDPFEGCNQQHLRDLREEQEGMLLQIDGSRHPWLGDRGPWLSLIAAIKCGLAGLLATL